MDGYREGIIALGDGVRMDVETLIDDIASIEARRQQSQVPPKEKACICVAMDSHKNIVAKRMGGGRSSGQRVGDALGQHSATGATSAGDRERIYDKLAGKAARSISRAWRWKASSAPGQPVPLVVQGHADEEPPKVVGLVCLPVQGEPGEVEVGSDESGLCNT